MTKDPRPIKCDEVFIPDEPHKTIVEVVDLQAMAEHLGVVPNTIRNLVGRKQFPAPFRVGRQLRWRIAEVNAWIENQTKTTTK